MRFGFPVVVVAAFVAGAPAVADNLEGQNAFLCSTAQAVVCVADEDCEYGSSFTFNVPQFIEVDLTAKILRTTKASPAPRETPILSLQRSSGLIILQGVERGRAFSFVISEATGEVTAAVARDGLAVAVFGACTPLPAARPAATPTR